MGERAMSIDALRTHKSALNIKLLRPVHCSNACVH